jgi:hypothetical protein
MCRANVGSRRHRRDIGGERQNEARRRGTRARRSDEDGDRRARRDHARHHRARRLEEPSRGAEIEDDEAGARGIRTGDDFVKKFGGDGVNDAVVFDDNNGI